jgi:hypothetical protein
MPDDLIFFIAWKENGMADACFRIDDLLSSNSVNGALVDIENGSDLRQPPLFVKFILDDRGQGEDLCIAGSGQKITDAAGHASLHQSQIK